VTFTTIAFQTAMRAACVTLLTNYASSASLKLQVYPGRPRTLYPPTGFVDALSETINLDGPRMRQRFVRATITVVHGLFDTAEAAAQRDAFVDGFADWVLDNPAAAGAATLIGDSIGLDDLPSYVPEWILDAPTYYATNIVLSGYAGG
jgi:hypothetical protein